MKFPNRALKSLCDYYDNVSDYSPKEENELLERLLTDEDMIPVWRAYREIYKAPIWPRPVTFFFPTERAPTKQVMKNVYPQVKALKNSMR